MNQDYYPCVHRDSMWCKKFSVDGKLSYCSLRYEDPCPHQTLSNADRIRAMTDEELGEFLGEWASDPKFWKCDGHGECLNWLQQPCGGADHA